MFNFRKYGAVIPSLNTVKELKSACGLQNIGAYLIRTYCAVNEKFEGLRQLFIDISLLTKYSGKIFF